MTRPRSPAPPARRAAAPGSRPSGAASAVCVTGPRPSSRPRRISTSASSRDHVAPAWSAGGAIAGSSRAGPQRLELGQPLGRNPSVACGAFEARDALLARQRARASRSIPARPRASASVEAAEPQQRVVQFLGVGRVGPASSRTRAIASGSSRPSSAALSGSSQRRAITAWVRRSSSGASSRKA